MNKPTNQTDNRGGAICAGTGPKTSNAATADGNPSKIMDAADHATAVGEIVYTDTPAASSPRCLHCGATLQRGFPLRSAADGTLRVTCGGCGEIMGMDVCPLKVWRLTDGC